MPLQVTSTRFWLDPQERPHTLLHGFLSALLDREEHGDLGIKTWSHRTEGAWVSGSPLGGEPIQEPPLWKAQGGEPRLLHV